MRGGTSRGPFLLASDLPQRSEARDAVLLAIIGAGHGLQVDGIGGGNPQTSKVAMVSRTARPGCDVDYLFAQVGITTRTVDTRPNCGNMLAGVGPFAIEAGLVAAARDGETTVRIHNVNTGAKVDAVIQTPGGVVTYEGDTAISGVPGTGARIELLFRDFMGAKTGKLFPSGHASEMIEEIETTLIDSAVPMMLVRAGDLGIDPSRPWSVEENAGLIALVEGLRCEAGRRMGLGDVAGSVVPKVGIVGASADDALPVAYLMPWQMHKSLAVTGAICLATAMVTPGTIAHGATHALGDTARLRHPSGIMEVALRRDGSTLVAAGVVRTARRLFEGYALVPEHLFTSSTDAAVT